MSLFGIKGVHVPHRKHTADCHPERMPIPKTVVIPMAQHIGAPAKPVVNVGDTVGVGQVIGEAVGFISAPVHASISGTVKKIDTMPNSNGGTMTAITIESDGEMRARESVVPPTVTNYEEFVAAVRASGIVGLGGAGFPTFVKLSVKDLSQVQEVVLNGAECEPYITGDHRAMLERPEQIIGGATYLAKMFGVDKVIIGVEDNKQNGIDAMNKAIAEMKAPVVVEPLHCRYPQGGEKQLCQAITGRQVPPGGLPSNIGCAVFNINTTCCIYRAITEGMPVVNKIVTVSGSGVVEPKNLECPIGTPVSCLFDACGGLKDGTYKLIAGGPMMGMAQYTAEVPVGKGTGAMLAFCDKEEQTVEHPQCIRCGKCVAACPVHLEPLFMYQYAEKGMVDELNAANIMDCMECGACSYACPARMHLTHMFKTGKQLVKDKAAADKAAAEAKAAKEKEEKEAVNK